MLDNTAATNKPKISVNLNKGLFLVHRLFTTGEVTPGQLSLSS